jgi:NAD(P)-dependent dehydrogenase (short-subunit alcohol dehydrogenase family)
MPSPTSLAGKRILVTGGTTGIGREVMALLAAEGAQVLTCGRHRRELDDALAYARGRGGEVSGMTADVSRRDDVEALFAHLDETLGGLDMLVCCAGLGAEPIHEMADDAWRNVIETNLVGYLACAKAALSRMIAQGQGHLVFISSISPEIKAPGESVYSASKAGIEAFAQTLRKEVAEQNIKISIVQPGSVDTDMQECSDEEKREAVSREAMLHAEEVADAVVYILTRSARTDVVALRIEPRLQKTS